MRSCQLRCVADNLGQRDVDVRARDDFQCQKFPRRSRTSQDRRGHSRTTRHRISRDFMIKTEAREMRPPEPPRAPLAGAGRAWGPTLGRSGEDGQLPREQDEPPPQRQAPPVGQRRARRGTQTYAVADQARRGTRRFLVSVRERYRACGCLPWNEHAPDCLRRENSLSRLPNFDAD